MTAVTGRGLLKNWTPPPEDLARAGFAGPFATGNLKGRTVCRAGLVDKPENGQKGSVWTFIKAVAHRVAEGVKDLRFKFSGAKSPEWYRNIPVAITFLENTDDSLAVESVTAAPPLPTPQKSPGEHADTADESMTGRLVDQLEWIQSSFPVLYNAFSPAVAARAQCSDRSSWHELGQAFSRVLNASSGLPGWNGVKDQGLHQVQAGIFRLGQVSPASPGSVEHLSSLKLQIVELAQCWHETADRIKLGNGHDGRALDVLAYVVCATMVKASRALEEDFERPNSQRKGADAVGVTKTPLALAREQGRKIRVTKPYPRQAWSSDHLAPDESPPPVPAQAAVTLRKQVQGGKVRLGRDVLQTRSDWRGGGWGRAVISAAGSGSTVREEVEDVTLV